MDDLDIDEAAPEYHGDGNSPYAAWSDARLDDMISQFADLRRHPAYQEIDAKIREQARNVMEDMVRTSDTRELRIQQGYVQGLQAMIHARETMAEGMIAERQARDGYVAPSRPLDDRGL